MLAEFHGLKARITGLAVDCGKTGEIMKRFIIRLIGGIGIVAAISCGTGDSQARQADIETAVADAVKTALAETPEVSPTGLKQLPPGSNWLLMGGAGFSLSIPASWIRVDPQKEYPRRENSDNFEERFYEDTAELVADGTYMWAALSMGTTATNQDWVNQAALSSRDITDELSDEYVIATLRDVIGRTFSDVRESAELSQSRPVTVFRYNTPPSPILGTVAFVLYVWIDHGKLWRLTFSSSEDQPSSTDETFELIAGSLRISES